MSDQFDSPDINVTVQHLIHLLDNDRIDAAVDLLLDMHKADQAEAFNELNENQQDALLQKFARLDAPAAADLLEELADKEVLEAVDVFATAQLADLLDEMEPDEAADLLGDMPPDQANAVLAEMEDAAEVIPLLGYPDESAGGRMTTAFIALRRQTTAEQAIQFLRQVSPEAEVPYYLYVIDRERRLVGVVGLRDLIIANPSNTMENILNPDVVHIGVGVDQEEVARIMTRYDLVAIPVVNEQNRLVGVITHDDILDVLEEEATEDIYRLGNVTDNTLEPDSSVVDQMRGRLPWLFLNTLTALFASWIVSNFESLIAEVAILAAFPSLVAGLGGNSASQNIVMVVRSLALGKMDSRRLWRVLGRQLIIGFLQGMAVGAFVGIGVGFWQGNITLGFVLFLSMIFSLMFSNILGVLVPIFVMAVGKDPALASSVLVTAATDSFGFFIFLILASTYIRLLAI